MGAGKITVDWDCIVSLENASIHFNCYSFNCLVACGKFSSGQGEVYFCLEQCGSYLLDALKAVLLHARKRIQRQGAESTYQMIAQRLLVPSHWVPWQKNDANSIFGIVSITRWLGISWFCRLQPIGRLRKITSVESGNKTLHFQAGNGPLRPMNWVVLSLSCSRKGNNHAKGSRWRGTTRSEPGVR